MHRTGTFRTLSIRPSLLPPPLDPAPSPPTNPPTHTHPQAAPQTEQLGERILKQVEYYFSPKNLPRDAFLQSQMNDNLEVSLFSLFFSFCFLLPAFFSPPPSFFHSPHPAQVPFATIAGFRKVTELTKDADVVLEALKDSEVLSVQDTGLKHAHAVRCAKSFVVDSDAHQLTEDEVRSLFDKVMPELLNEEGSWVATFESEEEARVHKERVHGKHLPNHTEILKTYARITYSSEAEEAERLALRMNHGRHPARPGQVTRQHEFPAVYRPLLVGKNGSNIKKLQEQFPSLHIDTRSDEKTISITANSDDTIDRAITEIDKYAHPGEERTRARDTASTSSPTTSAAAAAVSGGESPNSKPMRITRVSSNESHASSGTNSSYGAMGGYPGMLSSMGVPGAAGFAGGVGPGGANMDEKTLTEMQNQQQRLIQEMRRAQARMHAQAQMQAQMHQQMEQQAHFQVHQAQQMAMLQAMQNPAAAPACTKELRIPSANTGLLIGKKGLQKSKIEEQFPGCKIKVMPPADGSAQKDTTVVLQANDMQTCNAVATYIMTNFGTAPDTNKGMHPHTHTSHARVNTHTPPSVFGMGGMGGMPGVNNPMLGMGGLPGMGMNPMGMPGQNASMGGLGAGNMGGIAGGNPMSGGISMGGVNPMAGQMNPMAAMGGMGGMGGMGVLPGGGLPGMSKAGGMPFAAGRYCLHTHVHTHTHDISRRTPMPMAAALGGAGGSAQLHEMLGGGRAFK